MNTNEAPEQIEIVSEIIDIDLTPALARVYELAHIGRQLRERRAPSMGSVRYAAIEATTGTADAFPAAWEAVQQQMVTVLAMDELEAAAWEANSKASDKAAAIAAFDALELVTEYVQQQARDLAGLNLAGIKTAEAAIAAGAAEDYTRANTILDTLTEIANIPGPGEREAPWVLISPPALPDAHTDRRTDRPRLRDLEDTHDAQELELIRQAVEIRKASTLRDKIIAAVRCGWELIPATSAGDVADRDTRHHRASHISDGSVSRAID